MRKLPVIIMVLMVAAASLAALALDHVGVMDESSTDAADPVYLEAGTWDELQAQIEKATYDNKVVITLTDDIEGPSTYGLKITHRSVDIDLHGHKIDAKETAPYKSWSTGGVFSVSGSVVKIYDSVGGGILKGGMAASGGGIYVSNVYNMAYTAPARLTLENVIICDCGATDEGGGIYCDKQDSVIVVNNCRITDNTAYNGGGIATYGTVTVRGGTLIMGNTATFDGGGIYARTTNSTSPTTVVENSSITFNEAGSSGGAVRVFGGTFTMAGGTMMENKAVTDHGGAVYVGDWGTFNVRGGTIVGNHATQHGGGVVVTNGCRMTVQGTVNISDNPAGVGRGIALRQGTILEFAGKVSDNSVIDIRGLEPNMRLTSGVCWSETSQHVVECRDSPNDIVFNGIDWWRTNDRVTYDTSGGEGGLTNVVNGGTPGGLRILQLTGGTERITINDRLQVKDGRNIILDTNGHKIQRVTDQVDPELDGHVVEVFEGTCFTLMDSLYEKSGAAVKDGGLYGGRAIRGGGVNVHETGSLVIWSGYISEGGGGQGGGIYCRGTLVITGGTIARTACSNNGAGLFLNETGNAFIKGAKFVDNICAGWDNGGGGAMWLEGSATIIDCIIERNQGYYIINSGSWYGTPYGSAGAVAIKTNGTVTIQNCTLSNNKSGLDAGCIMVLKGSLVLRDCLVSNNVAECGDGGGLWVAEGASADVQGCTISFNKAGWVDKVYFEYCGGGIHSKGTLNIRNSSVNYNDAYEGGGGLFIVGSATITDSKVEGNKTHGMGGGIYSKNSTVTLNNVSLDDNNSLHNAGGGIYCYEGTTLHLKDIHIESCSVRTYGGALYIHGNATRVTIDGMIYMARNYAGIGPSVYMSHGKVLEVAGQLVSGSRIQVDLEDDEGTITSGFASHNPETDPKDIFSTIFPLAISLQDGEAKVIYDTGYSGAEYFIPRNQQIVLDKTLIDSRNWMSGLSGERQLNEINILGTNESGTADLNDDWSDLITWGKDNYEHQYYSIKEQLDMGVRMFEFCVMHEYYETTWLFLPSNEDDGKNLWLMERTSGGLYYCKGPDMDGDYLSLDTTLGWIKEFLKRHPSETVIIEFKYNRETGFDETMERLCTILTNLSNEKNPSTGESYLYQEPGKKVTDLYTRYPLLKDCRGKVVVMAEDDVSEKIGGMNPYKLGSKVLENSKPDMGLGIFEDVVERLAVYEIYDLVDFYAKHGLHKLKRTADHYQGDQNYAYVIHANVDHDYFLTPLEAAQYVNILFNGSSDIPGLYRGFLWLDGVTPSLSYGMWNTNYIITMYHSVNVKANDGEHEDQVYGLLANTKITIPGNIYKNTTNFAGWIVTDDTGTRAIDPGAEYPVTGHVTFTAVWASTVQVPVQVSWLDGNDADGLRPEGEELEAIVTISGTPTSVPLTEANGWRGVIDVNQSIDSVKPVWAGVLDDTDAGDGWHGYDADGKYQYKVIGSAALGYTISLRHTPTIEVKINWMLDASHKEDRPDQVTVFLFDGTELIDTATVAKDANGEYRCTFKPDPNREVEGERRYSAVMAPVSKYYTNSLDCTIYNFYNPSADDNYLIIWDDDGDRSSLRPSQITLNYTEQETSKHADVAVKPAPAMWQTGSIEDLTSIVSASEEYGYEPASIQQLDGTGTWVIRFQPNTQVKYTVLWKDEGKTSIRPTDPVEVILHPGEKFTHPDGTELSPVNPTITYKDRTGTTEYQPSQLKDLKAGLYTVEIAYPETASHKAMSATTMFQVRGALDPAVVFQIHMNGWVAGNDPSTPYLTWDNGSDPYIHPDRILPQYTYYKWDPTEGESGAYVPTDESPSSFPAGLYKVMATFAATEHNVSMSALTMFQVKEDISDASMAYEIYMPGWIVGQWNESYNTAMPIRTDTVRGTFTPAKTSPEAEYTQSSAISATLHEGQAKRMSLTVQVDGYNTTTARVGETFIVILTPASTILEATNKINAIGTVVYTDECYSRIQAAWDAYNHLSVSDRLSGSMVEPKQTLDQKTAEYNGLKADYEAAHAVEALIENAYSFSNNPKKTPEQVAEAIQAARTGYDALSDDQKLIVANYAILLMLEESLDDRLVFTVSIEGWYKGDYSPLDNSPAVLDKNGAEYTHPAGILPTYLYRYTTGLIIANPSTELNKLPVGTYLVEAHFVASDDYPAVSAATKFTVLPSPDLLRPFEVRMTGWLEYGNISGGYDPAVNIPQVYYVDNNTPYVHPAGLKPTYTYLTLDGSEIPSSQLQYLMAGVYMVKATYSVTNGFPEVTAYELFQVKKTAEDPTLEFEVRMKGWIDGYYSEENNNAKPVEKSNRILTFKHPASTSEFPVVPTVSYMTLQGGVIEDLGEVGPGIYMAAISYPAVSDYPAVTAYALFQVTSSPGASLQFSVAINGWVSGGYEPEVNSPSVVSADGTPYVHPDDPTPLTPSIHPTYTYYTFSLTGGKTPIVEAELPLLPPGVYFVTASYERTDNCPAISSTAAFRISEATPLTFKVDMPGWQYPNYDPDVNVAKPVNLDGTPYVHPATGPGFPIEYEVSYTDLDMNPVQLSEMLEPGIYMATITYPEAGGYPSATSVKVFIVEEQASQRLNFKVSMAGWVVGAYDGHGPTVKDADGNPFVHPAGVQPEIAYYDMDDNPVVLSNSLPMGNYRVTVSYAAGGEYPAAAGSTYFRVSDGRVPVQIDPALVSIEFDKRSYDGDVRKVIASVGQLTEGTDYVVKILQDGRPVVPRLPGYYDIFVVLTNMDCAFESQDGPVPSYSISLRLDRASNKITELYLRGWVAGDEPNTPVVVAYYGADEATFLYAKDLEGTFVEEVPDTAGTWYIKATIAPTDLYFGAVETASFVISLEPGPPVDPTIVIVNPDGSITRERIDTKIDPDGTKTVTVDAVTTYPDGKYVESYSVTVSKDGESTMTETSRIKSPSGAWSIEATIETIRPQGPNIRTTVTSDDGAGYAVSEALISGVGGWHVDGDDIEMALEQSEDTVDMLGISGPVQWRIGLFTGDVVDMTIYSDSLQQIADNDANLVITSDEGEVVYDTKALDTLASLNKSIRFDMRVDHPDDINSVQRKAIGDAPFVFVSASIDGRYITDLGGGTLSITFPYEADIGERSVVKAYFVDRDGYFEEVDCRYSADSKTVTITTPHHSIYTIKVEELPLIVLGYGSLTLMVISAMAAAVVIASAYVIRTKKIRVGDSSDSLYPHRRCGGTRGLTAPSSLFWNR